MLSALRILLSDYFENIVLLTSPNTLMSELRDKNPDVVLLDMNFSAGINSGNEGLFWLSEIKKADEELPVVLFTAYADIDLAVKALKGGATDFVVKPWDNAKLLATLQSAYSLRQSRKEVKKLREKQSVLNRDIQKEEDICWGKSGASNPHVAKVREMAKEEGAEVFVICAQIEQELSELSDEEKKEYLDDLGVSSSGLDKLVAASYSLLGLISFLTAGEDECRAWTIKKGTKAPQAAGKIHTDFERGFIKAEVVNYQDLLDNGSLAAAREKGIVGMEGKDYVVKDGDVILFRFNV